MDAIARQHGLYFEDLDVGMTASHAKIVTEADIMNFAEISGDFNPVHIDPDYAAKSIFKERIAHGILSAALLSAVFGMKLPGPGCIYVSQTLNFRAPVKIGDEVEARVEVQELIEAKRRAIFACECVVGETVVLEGEAVMLLPRRPD
ncbi:MAG: MaoC family dehydratase [Hyphomicrobiaceae bacterium]